MTTAVFQILLSLADADRHGYGIMREVEERTGGEFELGPGTLYRSIQRLVQEGWIESCPPPAREEDQRRIFYRLTQLGREALVSDARSLSSLLLQVKAKRVLEG